MLTAEQRARLPEVLARDAEASGFVREIWTTPRVAEVIEQEFGARRRLNLCAGTICPVDLG
jgi:hypothetical protein